MLEYAFVGGDAAFCDSSLSELELQELFLEPRLLPVLLRPGRVTAFSVSPSTEFSACLSPGSSTMEVGAFVDTIEADRRRALSPLLLPRLSYDMGGRVSSVWLKSV